jgi:tetratricopeptide (TPR) repeat protein
MNEVFKELFSKASDIIREAAQNPLGLASLSALILGALGLFLFRSAAGKLKLLALAMITAGLLGLTALVAIYASNPNPVSGPPQPDIVARALADGRRLYFAGKSDEAIAVHLGAIEASIRLSDRTGQAKLRKSLADFQCLIGHDNEARANYGKALVLYKQINDPIGQADVLKVLGEMEYVLGHNDQARDYYEEALKLYQKEGKIRSQADMMFKRSIVISVENPELGSAYRDEAAKLYQMVNFAE